MSTGKIGVSTGNLFPIIKKFLYSDHEIFLREIVSNAVDASQKMKVLASNGEFKGELGELKVRVKADKAAGTLTVSDNGIGMTEEEVENREIQYKLYSLEAFDETKFSDEDVERILHEAINRLPEQCRRIFIESKLNNKKYQDIADEMGLSLQTVKNQVMIAVRKLREDLKDYLPLLVFLLG